jgi:phosphodiesterase/alkaline phosphatase D-like protein
MSVREFAQLPCFGMWADHEALQDSGAWVRKERAQWHKRDAHRRRQAQRYDFLDELSIASPSTSR